MKRFGLLLFLLGALGFFQAAGAADCPAAGTARLGLSRRTLLEKAIQAQQSADPQCAARGLALADWLDREGRGACEALARIDNQPEGEEDADLLAFQGALAWRCGRPRAAHRAALRALALDPSATLAWTTLGRLLEARFLPAAALSAFRQALKQDPEDPGALMGLARLTSQRPERLAALDRYLARGVERGEPPERMRAARESWLFVKELGDRRIWILERADLPADLAVEPLASRPGHLAGLVVRLRLGSEEQVPALWDSGASGLHLSPQLARRAGLESLAPATLVGGGGTKEHAVLRGVIPLLDLGPLAFREALGVVAAQSLHSQGAYQAILGVDILGGTRMTFQAGFSSIRIEEAYALPPPDDPREADPWDLEAGEIPLYAVEGQLLVPVALEGVGGNEEGLALIDTGASGSLIELETAERIGGLRRGGVAEARAYGGALPLQGTLARVTVRSGRLRHPLHRVSVIDLASRRMMTGVRVSGFLGLDLLSAQALTLDLARGSVTWLETVGDNR